MAGKIQITTWNMDFWRRTCDSPETEFYKTNKEISFWKKYASPGLS
jgi:hypothetical protein